MSPDRERILILGADPHLRGSLASIVYDLGEVLQSDGRPGEHVALRHPGIDVVIADLGSHDSPAGEAGALGAVEEIRRALPEALVLALSARGDPPIAERAAEAGVYGLLTKPVDPGEIRLLVRLAIERRRSDRSLARLREEVQRRYGVQALVGTSPQMDTLKAAIWKIADSDIGVLIRGENGAGRESAARAIHFASSRRDGRFVPVYASLLSGHEAEVKIFGGRDGSPGRGRRRGGSLALADQGTLYIDEVGALSPTVQAGLLRFLETGEIEGSPDVGPIAADVRLIAATARDPDREVGTRRLRKDILDRIAAARIEVPSLRERPEDIAPLAAHFLSRAAVARGGEEKRISPAAVACLESYPWPGNVRELKTVMESVDLLADGAFVRPEHLPRHVRGSSHPTTPPPSIPEEGILWERQVETFERGLLEEALRLSKGKKTEAAQRLGLKKDQMKYLCRKYRL